MFNFSSGGLDFGSGSGGMRHQYLLVGALAVIVAGSGGSAFWYAFMPHHATVDLPKEYHMFCANCNKEVIVPVGQSPGNLNAPGASGAGGSAAPSTGPGGLERGICPVCVKPALIRERMCP